MSSWDLTTRPGTKIVTPPIQLLGDMPYWPWSDLDLDLPAAPANNLSSWNCPIWYMKPLPSSPMRYDTGTRTSSKYISAVSELCMPILEIRRASLIPERDTGSTDTTVHMAYVCMSQYIDSDVQKERVLSNQGGLRKHIVTPVSCLSLSDRSGLVRLHQVNFQRHLESSGGSIHKKITGGKSWTELYLINMIDDWFKWRKWGLTTAEP